MKKNMTIIISLRLSPILQDKYKYNYKNTGINKIRNLTCKVSTLIPFVTLIMSCDKLIHTHFILFCSLDKNN